MKPTLPAMTIFCGSFLLFCMQPLVGRTLLPGFGGSAAVWTVCLVTYQLLLLAGYYYAHRLECGRRSGGTGAGRLHLALLVAAVVWVALFGRLRPLLGGWVGRGAYPAWEVLLCALGIAGLPYVLFSANSTLVQAWLSGGPEDGATTGRSKVYGLYAVSNAGSLCGLLSYPLLVEPALSLDQQWYGFAGGLALYAALLFRLMRRFAGAAGARAAEERADAGAGGGISPYWLLLPAVSTFLLNAVTTHLCNEVIPIPLLWAVLLALFLLSYIIGFSAFGQRACVFLALATALVLFGSASAARLGGAAGYLPNLASGLLLLLVGCSFLHSWLYSLRPDPARLTTFYLCLALGGAAGGVLAGVAAPLAFPAVYEYPLGLAVLLGLVVARLGGERPAWLKGPAAVARVVCVVALVVLARGVVIKNSQTLWRARNFYGCLTVRQETSRSRFGDPIPYHTLSHGETLHGLQFQPHYIRNRATTYYGPYGGGFALLNHPAYREGRPLSVGVVGLGVGTLACWGRTNDTFRFFEINPQVVEAASNTNLFSYLSDSDARVTLALGDARKTLASETNTYDVLVIDAYSGDAVPIHLATREAFQLYFSRLNTNGILALHISNWHIDLHPLCKAVGEAHQIPYYGVNSAPAGTWDGASWVFLTHLPLLMRGQEFRETDWAQVRTIRLPEDDKGSLMKLVRYRFKPPSKPIEIDLRRLY